MTKLEMATIFFTCLQCGEYLKSNHYMVAKEVATHMCRNKFDSEEFQKGIAVLQAEQNMKSVPSPPPIPPPMPAVPLYVAANKRSRSSFCNKGLKRLKSFLIK